MYLKETCILAQSSNYFSNSKSVLSLNLASRLEKIFHEFCMNNENELEKVNLLLFLEMKLVYSKITTKVRSELGLNKAKFLLFFIDLDLVVDLNKCFLLYNGRVSDKEVLSIFINQS